MNSPSGDPGLPDHKVTALSYLSRPLLAVLFLGFSSGLPLALTATTLGYWLADAHIDKTRIGLFGAAATPYALKFLWAPVMDGLRVPLLSKLLGRRRGWILLTQAGLLLALMLLAATQPEINPWMTALVALLVAFLSASQDIVIDAYRVERLTPQTQGQGAAMAQLGYQLGMIAAGFGALHLAARYGWQAAYFGMAGFMGIGIVTTLLAREPEVSAAEKPARDYMQWLRESVIAPFTDFMRHPDWLLILLFVVVYKLADAFLGRMTSPFFHDMHFAKDDIANIVKFYGTIATLAGIFAGGTLTGKFGALRVMLLAGLLHGVTNLLYVRQAQLGPDTDFLAMSIAVENFTGGVSSAAFVAYLSNLTTVHYTATQYALLSSLAAFGRTWLATPAGWVAEKVGWEWFFGLSAALALPGLVLLLLLHKRLTLKATSLPAAGTSG